MTIDAGAVRAALARVMDPEIPVVSIVDLGIVERIDVVHDTVEVDLLPTFSGCPALDVIREDVERAIEGLGASARVRFVNSPPWTTDRMSDAARDALGTYGVAPPLLQITSKRACPYCGSTATIEESRFGPTLCRSIRYCSSCRNPYEAFKVKQTDSARTPSTR